MEYVIGSVLGVVIGVFATIVGLDRDRALYPTAMIVIASYYDLFAVMGGTTNALILESLVGTVFVLMAVIGFRRNLWLVAFAIIAHGVQDLFNPHIIENSGTPSFWPGFCSSIDVVLGMYLGWLLYSRRLTAVPATANAI